MTMLKPKEMAERLGVTVRTLQIWDSKGVLKAYRTPTIEDITQKNNI